VTLKLAYEVHILVIVLLAVYVLKQVRFPEEGQKVVVVEQVELAEVEEHTAASPGPHDISPLAQAGTTFALP
jgi:hypothetical protein